MHNDTTTTRIASRVAALASAAVFTLALLAGIDTLATSQPAAQQMVQAKAPSKG